MRGKLRENAGPVIHERARGGAEELQGKDMSAALGNLGPGLSISCTWLEIEEALTRGSTGHRNFVILRTTFT